MSNQYKENLLAACLNGIRSDEFVESLIRRGAVYTNDDGEETEEPCGRYCMFYVTYDLEDIAFIATRDINGIVITCPSVPSLKVLYTHDPINHTWSGIRAVKSTLDDSYIYMHQILHEVIGKLKVVL